MNHGREEDKKCDACGAPIFFIQTKGGKYMPVDTKLTVAKEDDPNMTIVLTSGVVQRGVKQGDCGYISHFATCTDPARFRK